MSSYNQHRHYSKYIYYNGNFGMEARKPNYLHACSSKTALLVAREQKTEYHKPHT
jgi:hypothetical protein